MLTSHWQGVEANQGFSMPLRLKTPCRYPGCHRANRGRFCEEHQGSASSRPSESRRGTAAERGYDANWRRLRPPNSFQAKASSPAPITRPVRLNTPAITDRPPKTARVHALTVATFAAPRICLCRRSLAIRSVSRSSALRGPLSDVEVTHRLVHRGRSRPRIIHAPSP